MQDSIRDSVRSFRIYLIDGVGRIARAACEVEASTDEEACEHATLLLDGQSNYRAVEVWDRARLVRHIPS